MDQARSGRLLPRTPYARRSSASTYHLLPLGFCWPTTFHCQELDQVKQGSARKKRVLQSSCPVHRVADISQRHFFLTLNYSEKSGTLSLNNKLHSLFQRAHQTRHNEKGTNPRADVEVTGGIVSENTKVLQEIQRPNKCSVQLFKNMVLPDDGWNQL